MFGRCARRELAQLHAGLRRTVITVLSDQGVPIMGPMDLYQLMLVVKYGGYSMQGELPTMDIGYGRITVHRTAAD